MKINKISKLNKLDIVFNNKIAFIILVCSNILVPIPLFGVVPGAMVCEILDNELTGTNYDRIHDVLDSGDIFDEILFWFMTIMASCLGFTMYKIIF